MTVAIIQDCRNPAQRTTVLENPFWISSGLVDASASASIADKVIILFSFPNAGQKVLVKQFCAEVILAFTASTTGIVGYYTIPTDSVTPGTTEATIVSTANQLEHTTDTTYTTAGLYFPSADTTAMAADVLGFPVAAANLITGAASTVYCICVTFTGSVPLVGKVRYHALITVVPTAAA